MNHVSIIAGHQHSVLCSWQIENSVGGLKYSQAKGLIMTWCLYLNLITIRLSDHMDWYQLSIMAPNIKCYKLFMGGWGSEIRIILDIMHEQRHSTQESNDSSYILPMSQAFIYTIHKTFSEWNISFNCHTHVYKWKKVY